MSSRFFFIYFVVIISITACSSSKKVIIDDYSKSVSESTSIESSNVSSSNKDVETEHSVTENNTNTFSSRIDTIYFEKERFVSLGSKGDTIADNTTIRERQVSVNFNGQSNSLCERDTTSHMSISEQEITSLREKLDSMYNVIEKNKSEHIDKTKSKLESFTELVGDICFYIVIIFAFILISLTLYDRKKNSNNSR